MTTEPTGEAMPNETGDPRRVFAPRLFEGTTALVTGAGRGIGRSIALGFAELGADLVLASNEPEELSGVGEGAQPWPTVARSRREHTRRRFRRGDARRRTGAVRRGRLRHQ